MRLEPAIELIEHDAGFNDAASPSNIEIEDAVELAGTVEHQRRVDGLAGL